MANSSPGKLVALVIVVVLAVGLAAWSIMKVVHRPGMGPLTDEQRARMLRPGPPPSVPVQPGQ